MSQLAFGMPFPHDWAFPLLKSPASCGSWSGWDVLMARGVWDAGVAEAELPGDPCSRRTWIGLMRLGISSKLKS